VESPSIDSEEEFGTPGLEASVKAAANSAAEVRVRAERHEEREGLLGLAASIAGVALGAIATLGLAGVAPVAVAAVAIAALAGARAVAAQLIEVRLGPVSMRARRGVDDGDDPSSRTLTPALGTLAARLAAQRVALQELSSRHHRNSSRG
jgi:hypothetical protein